MAVPYGVQQKQRHYGVTNGSFARTMNDFSNWG